MRVLDELSEAIGRVGEEAGRSVVRMGGSWRIAAGVVIEAGSVLTNAHNVRAETVPVQFADGRTVEGRLAGRDADGDLAVVAVDTGDAQPLAWADEVPRVGAIILAVAPNGAGARVTAGTVSSVAQAFRGPRGRPIGGAVEHTAPLAPGSSGSPLLDTAGRLVGINTNRLGGGFYLALPADAGLRERVAALQRGEQVERPRLGVALAPPFAARRLRRAVGLPERDGVLVRAVESGSPAERAGVREGDLIVEAGGTPLREPDELHEILDRVRAGESLTLGLVRGEEERTVEARFEPDGPAEADPTEGPADAASSGGGPGPVH